MAYLCSSPFLMRKLLVFLLFLPVVHSSAQSGFVVDSVSPGLNALAVAAGAPIVIDLREPVEAASLGPAAVMAFGRWSGVMTGDFVLENDGHRLRFTPARDFLAGELVTVSLSRRLHSTTGAALGQGFAWQFWIATRPASLDLQETARLPVRTPGEGWIQTYGAYAGDLDEDGYTDFAVPNERTNDIRVFMNDGKGGYGGFSTYPIPGGARPSTNEGADFDLDGHIDFAVGNSTNDRVTLFRGDGTGALLPPSNYPVGGGVRGLAVLDLNGDGYPDIATANRNAGNVSWLLNEGDGTFAPAVHLTTPGVLETAAVAADANEDGVLDLFVGALGSQEILVLLGDGAGGLALHSRFPTRGNVWMITAGDVNGDGHVDVVSANADSDTASILLGDGTGGLSAPFCYDTGAFALAIDLGDLDGDGDLDLVTSDYNGASWTLYENAGDGTYGNRRTLAATTAGSCAVLHDRDRDGTLDMTGIDERDDLLFLFTNAPLAVDSVPPPPTVSLSLAPAFPNPFRERATLSFTLASEGPARLAIYDVLGRAVRVLHDAFTPRGRHTLTWDGADTAGRPLPAGTYFYRLETPTATRSHALLYLR